MERRVSPPGVFLLPTTTLNFLLFRSAGVSREESASPRPKQHRVKKALGKKGATLPGEAMLCRCSGCLAVPQANHELQSRPHLTHGAHLHVHQSGFQADAADIVLIEIGRDARG